MLNSDDGVSIIEIDNSYKLYYGTCIINWMCLLYLKLI